MEGKRCSLKQLKHRSQKCQIILIEVVDVKTVTDEMNSKCIPIFEINSRSNRSDEKSDNWKPGNAVTHSGEGQEGKDKRYDVASTGGIARRKAEPPCPPKPKSKAPPPHLSAPPPEAEPPWDARFGPPCSEHNSAVQQCL